jgi:hypothetical protein
VNRKEALKRRDEARKRRDNLDDAIADLLAEVELQQGAIKVRRKTRHQVQNPKHELYIEDDEKRSDRIEQLTAEIRKRLKEREAAAAEIERLTPRRAKAARAAKRWARKARNLVSPAVYDMGFDRGAVRPLYPMGVILGAVGHYTAGPVAKTREEAKELWRRYDAYHKSLSWACIGYNVGIDPEGGIALLRGPRYTGAHTLNYNSNRLGISAHGTTGDRLNLAQRRALRKIRRKWCKGKPCIGHRDAPGQSTACPGDMIESYRSWGKKP